MVEMVDRIDFRRLSFVISGSIGVGPVVDGAAAWLREEAAEVAVVGPAVTAVLVCTEARSIPKIREVSTSAMKLINTVAKLTLPFSASSTLSRTGRTVDFSANLSSCSGAVAFLFMMESAILFPRISSSLSNCWTSAS